MFVGGRWLGSGERVEEDGNVELLSCVSIATSVVVT